MHGRDRQEETESARWILAEMVWKGLVLALEFYSWEEVTVWFAAVP